MNGQFIYPGKPQQVFPDSDFLKTIVSDPKWIAEKKYNGWRCPTVIGNGEVKLWSRKGNPIAMKEEHKEIVKPILAELKERRYPDGIYDTELMGLRCKDHPASLHIFDLIYFEGEWLDKHPLKSRKGLLKAVTGHIEHHRVSVVEPYHVGQMELFRQLQEQYKDIKLESRFIEGVVFKHLDSDYKMSFSKPKSELINPLWIKVLI